MVKNKSRLHAIIWGMVSYWLIVDLFTGIFLNQGISMPISQVYKIILLTLVSIQLLKNDKVIIISLWCLYIAILVLNASFCGEPVGSTLILLSKFILTYLFYKYFKVYAQLYRKRILERSGKILMFSFAVVALNILIGLVGIGYYTYPSLKIGYKGFFYAGNELGGVLAVLVPFFLYYIFTNYNKLIYTLSSIFCIALSVLLGTKAFMLVAVISPILIMLLRGNKKTKIIVTSSLGAFFLIIIPIFINFLESNNLDLFAHLKYSFEKGGITSLIFSGRDEFWADESNDFYKSNIIYRILGLGGNRTVEMDFFDVLLNFGYLGIIIIYSSVFFLFRNSIINRRKNTFSKIVVLTNSLLLGMSFIAGHIIFSSMAGMYIALVNVIGSIPSKAIIYGNKSSYCI